MANENASNSRFMFFGLALVIIGLIGYVFLQNHSEGEQIYAEQSNSSPQQAELSENFLQKALKDRILGDPKAPVKISEHSSLTCGHCAQFHKTAYKQIKSEYIDTGKAYIVFSDFPLNGPAVKASMTARCLPEEKFFDYVQMLFETQDDWAYEKNFMDYLKKTSGEYGLSAEKFEQCVNDEDLQKGIFERLKAAQAQWEIGSTPSFVFNNTRVESGARPFEYFKTVIDEELQKVGANSSEALNLNE